MTRQPGTSCAYNCPEYISIGPGAYPKGGGQEGMFPNRRLSGLFYGEKLALLGRRGLGPAV